jgi:hypothetical protein
MRFFIVLKYFDTDVYENIKRKLKKLAKLLQVGGYGNLFWEILGTWGCNKITRGPTLHPIASLNGMASLRY